MGYKHVVVIESPGTDQEQVAAVFSATQYDLNKRLQNDLAEANYNLEVTKREVEEANKQIDILQHDIESAEDEADFLAELLIEQIDEAEKLDAELEKNSFSVSVKLDDETLDWLRETFNQPYHVKWYTVDEHGRPVEVN
jgi:septal ring factor EnvC (AmiA/AmiB activator)